MKKQMTKADVLSLEQLIPGKTWEEALADYDSLYSAARFAVCLRIKQLSACGGCTEAMRAELYRMIDDVMQETFADCLSRTETAAGERVLMASGTAIKRIMRQRYKARQALSLDKETETGETFAETVGQTEKGFTEAETAQAIRQAIRQAAENETDEKALYMMIFEGYTMRETAAALNITKRRTETLRNRLKSLLTD